MAILAALPWILGAVTAGETGYKVGKIGLSLYSGEITAGDVGRQVLGDLALRAVPGGIALVVAKKLNVDVYLKEGTKIFRMHGLQNKGIEGEFWTTKDPRMSKDFRNDAGLPDNNTAETLLQGKLKEGSFAGGRKAAPLDGNKGGWPETRLKNADKKWS